MHRQDMGHKTSKSSLNIPPSQHMTCSANQKLFEPCSMEVPLCSHYTLVINSFSNALLYPRWYRGWGKVESPKSPNTQLVPLATGPHPEAILPPTKSHLTSINSGMVARGYNNKDTPFTPITQEVPRVLGALYLEPESKTKYVFLIISQYHTGMGKEKIYFPFYLFHSVSTTTNNFTSYSVKLFFLPTLQCRKRTCCLNL